MNDNILTIEFSKKKPIHTLTFNNISNDAINIYVKSSGYIEKEFFTTHYKFVIDVDKLIIKDIFFISIIKHDDNSKSEKIFDVDDFTENYFEHKIYNFLKNILEKSVISINNNNLTLKITLFDIEYYLMIITYDIKNNMINNLSLNLNFNNTSEQIEVKQEKYLNNNSIATSTCTINKKLSDNISSTNNSSDNNLSNDDIIKSSEISNSSDLESSEYIKTEPEILKLLMWGSIISFTSHLFQEKVNVKTKK